VRLSALARRPALTVLVGAVAIAFSGILFRLAHVSPSTGAFYRCVWNAAGEEGKLTDAQGREVDFRNTIVIMTSNIGAAQISKNQSLGFTVGDESGLGYEDMKTKVMSELKKVFRPELLNRIDEVIVFHKLTKDEIKIIIELLMRRLREQMGTHEVTIELTDEAKDLLVEKGYDPAMGARPLRRAIQRYIEDPLADFVLGRSLEPGSTILVGRKGEVLEGEQEVDIVVLPPDVTAEKVTVPPVEEPAEQEETSVEE
jgi:ATP-dependent Clp protease ATP-binding subunit ClpC